MKKFIKENWLKLSIFFILIIIAYSIFYWYEWRPTQIKKECANLATVTINRNNAGRNYIPVAERADNNYTDFNNYYERCLKERGL